MKHPRILGVLIVISLGFLLMSCDTNGGISDSPVTPVPTHAVPPTATVELSTPVTQGDDTGSPAVPPPVGGPGGSQLRDITPESGNQSAADLLRHFEPEVDFPLAAPAELSGFIPSRASIFGEGARAVIQLSLGDPQNHHRYVTFEQTAISDYRPLPCPGTGDFMPPPGVPTPDPSDCSITEIEIQGVIATLQRDRRPMDNAQLITIIWRPDGITYTVIGTNVAEEEVISIANSVQMLR